MEKVELIDKILFNLIIKIIWHIIVKGSKVMDFDLKILDKISADILNILKPQLTSYYENMLKKEEKSLVNNLKLLEESLFIQQFLKNDEFQTIIQNLYTKILDEKLHHSILQKVVYVDYEPDFPDSIIESYEEQPTSIELTKQKEKNEYQKDSKSLQQEVEILAQSEEHLKKHDKELKNNEHLDMFEENPTETLNTQKRQRLKSVCISRKNSLETDNTESPTKKKKLEETTSKKIKRSSTESFEGDVLKRKHNLPEVKGVVAFSFHRNPLKGVKEFTLATFQEVVIKESCDKNWIHKLKCFVKAMRITHLHVQGRYQAQYLRNELNAYIVTLPKRDYIACQDCLNLSCSVSKVKRYFKEYHKFTLSINCC